MTADLDRTQPRSAELRLEAAGGARYLLLLYGMVAAFDSRGRWVGVTEDRASNFGQERVLAGRSGVVTLRIQDPEVAPPAGGRLVARYRPHVDRAARRRLERELLRNAQRSGHVRLTSNGRHLLGDTLLGREGIGPAEVRSLQADPDGLLDLPPDVLASLYRNDWVVDPPLPARLHSDYVRLLGPTAVDVWAVRER
mgnify:CR=1 FL=1